LSKLACQPVLACRFSSMQLPFLVVVDDLIQPDEIAYRLELTPAQLKIVHTALRSLFDDLGHEERDVKRVVQAVLAKLPGEHEIRAIDLARELRRTEAA
jgi:Fe-S cluster assembly scaffold protein SufB